MNQTTLAAAPQPGKPRMGCFAARIGAIFGHKLEQPLKLASGRIESAGRTIHLSIQDISRCPDAEPHMKWRCLHPECAGQRWASKRELVASHKPNRELDKLEESHCFYAVAHMPGVAAREAKIGKQGEVLEEAVSAKLPTILLLSDEE